MTMICEHSNRAFHCDKCGQELPKRIIRAKLHNGGGLWVCDYTLTNGVVFNIEFSAVEHKAAEMSLSHADKIARHFDNLLKIKVIEI